ncbi:hypothetical protein M5K25_010377 [Dendrobium thyrsiflorum]|uniref:Cns1/TTC4 wheel domain-containing protein n=1 Tax=Dendrobium thyrsiflorum TaxID=117978 RepID=A0ABD0V7D4_DENTH
MALLMAAGSEPQTDREREDLDAIAALKESAAIELKEQGNKYVKMGKKHYSDAIDCYSRAISQNSLSDSDQSVLFSNRAHVNLMLGNYRRAISDAEEAIKLCSTNAKMNESSTSQIREFGTSDSRYLIPAALKFVISNIKIIVPTQLSPDNYSIWRSQVLKLLTANGFYDFLLPSASPPTQYLTLSDGAQEPNPKYHEWVLVDQNLAAAVCSTISPAILPYVIHLDSTAAVWSTIERRLHSSNRSRVIQLKNELHNLQMKTLTMSQYLTQIKTIVDNITASGAVLDQEDILLYTLNSLPPSYNAFKTAIRTMLHPIDLDTIYSLLINEEINIQAEALQHLSVADPLQHSIRTEARRMVGEWMMDPIKIPWFRHPGPSWSLVYLVRGGSRPNLTEGSLLAAMGFDVIREHTGAGHNRNIVMPFGGESPGSEGPRWSFCCATSVEKGFPRAYYRAAKAAFSLELLMEAESFCNRGLELFPSNEEVKQLSVQIDSRKKECEHHKTQLSKVLETAKELASAFKTRGLKLGRTMYQELTGVKNPILDKNGILHWPVLLLYPETMSSDFIEEFCETDIFSAHLDLISFFYSYSTLPWDKENAYTREAIELYYQANTGVVLSKKKVLEYLLKGTVASHSEYDYDEDKDEVDHTEIPSSSSSSKWIKVNEKKTLNDILKQSDYIIPAIPVFFVISKRSSFYKEFRAGNWSHP